MISPEQASRLLDEVVYERVLSFVDLEELIRFEQDLWGALSDCGVEGDAVSDVAKDMIDRALKRLRDEDGRHAQRAARPGASVFGDCELCEQEARIHALKVATAKHRTSS